MAYFSGFKSVGLAIDALKFYKNNFISISLISLPILLPSAIVDEYKFSIFGLTHSTFLVEYSPIILDYFLYPIAVGALIASFSSTINDYNLSYSDCIKSGILNWPKLFIATIIAQVLITIGFILLIIPGFILVALLGFYDFYIVLENNEIIPSLKNSVNLSKNHLVEIIGSFLLLIAPIIWLHFVIYGPLSDLFASTKFASILIEVFMGIIHIVTLSLFFRLYWYLKKEAHNKRLHTDAAEPRR